MSDLPIDGDGHDGSESRRRQLLEVHEVRRRLERGAVTVGPVADAAMAIMRSQAVRELLELIAALDRRVPQVQRVGEASIARDAASLKARALKRIEEIEREPRSINELQ